MFDFEFYSPWFLLLFLLFIPLFIKDAGQRKRKGIKVPTTKNMDNSDGIRGVLFLLKISKYIILSALIIAMARPRTFTVSQDRDETKGVDIMLSIDVSLSMLAKDLNPDRITALKDIAVKFVQKRPNDRIGVVAYAAEAFTKVPVTSDHQVVIDEIKNLNSDGLEPGTAIGEGLSVAVNHLIKSKAKSKVVILMTDGVSNIQNAIPPQIAAELAKNNNIKVYSIGIGTNGYALMPTAQDIFGDLVFTEAEVTIDENTLREIAQTTGGKYFRATSNSSLEEIYNEINQLEKSDVKISKLYNYEEYFKIFLWIALGMLFLDALLRWVFYKILS
ncbi:VWA domain-containing protein [Chryseobacterium indologenes]|uniref:VWA domain-containing protein n=1 Tax=Chryseobacterium indologenes TaxID=253 RepID=A0A1Z3W3G8_CHRID|nr:VWA domain-containing protein [Chryseobacterium indologenes]ASE62234.1 VWA domain-containing protein [Chryseobacterium indologenes]ATN06071.1 VWA domain-containing protein [Chryseobacterium indologenes]AYY85168.1 VWA domain-containing protein [Chryseobacterium indologenes]AYZ34840.1 VWA domain-containing protein [Chryseobacterium indologenes]AZB17948.1 VWA domain-containing protein [Chryseobacterium indologenes]